MGIFESHAHYDDEAFNDDRRELLKKLPESGIEYVINVGASMESTRSSVALASEYDYIYAAVGVHPSETAPLNEEFIQYMKDEALHNMKVVAVGEIGLDYYWNEPDTEIQKKWFIRQLELALDVDKPIIIHSREAAKDTADILLSDDYLGVGGVVTYKNARKLVDTVSMMPLSRILLETDSPYLTPVPNRGQRNSSLNLPYVVDKIAELKNVSAREVTDITNENARRLFGI